MTKFAQKISTYSASLMLSVAMMVQSCGQPHDTTNAPLPEAEAEAKVEKVADGLTIVPVKPAQPATPMTAKTESSSKSIDTNRTLTDADQRSRATAAGLASDRVTAEITFKKSQILGKTFLYGFDLQYSAGADAKLALIEQSMALGHVPVTFHIAGNKLQVLTDSTRLFESAVNHPETLVLEFAITSQNDDTLTVAIEHTGVLVHKTVNGNDAPSPADSWIRSVKFIDDGNYLLIESAILQANGKLQTFMESLFPRDTLVPDKYKGIEDNRDTNDDASRFMFINNEDVYVQRDVKNGVPVREQTRFANRFNLPTKTSTIDWYVTPNMPDSFMKEMKSGIEGWNRYFKDQLGRDVVQFKGRLPDGVKLGDPRYNVVNFDTVAQAGAAYETQAADPLTGIQSHSMIYMPYAWYNIASTLSDARELPSSSSLAELEPKSTAALFGTKHRVIQCTRDAADGSTLPIQEKLAAAKTDGDAASIVDEFGRRVFISTLFHEMGHSFGLGHNFKGSLAYDGTKPVDFASNPTTYSVMDYNYYQSEVDLMSAIGGSDGPKLEYDRQAMSMLYNDGKDIKKTDKKIPACNDEDADRVTGGVDPDCIRYDAESNPTIGLQHALTRLTGAANASGIETKTLSQAIELQADRIISELSDAKKVPNAAAAKKLMDERTKALGKLVGYYIATGAQSLKINLKLNAVDMRKWRTDPSKDGITMSESDRRELFLSILETTLKMNALPDSAVASLKRLGDLVTAVVQSDRFGTVAERTALTQSLVKGIQDQTSKEAVTDFAAVRAAVVPTLVTGAGTAPFAAYIRNGKTMEQVAFESLRSIVTMGLTSEALDASGPQAARLAAAAGLATYAQLGDDYTSDISALKSELEKIRNLAKTTGKQDVIDHVRLLLKAIDAKPAAEQKKA